MTGSSEYSRETMGAGMARSLERPTNGRTSGPITRARPSPAMRRYRYRRRHTPHFYIVTTAVSAAGVACILTSIAFVRGDVTLATVAFGAVVLAMVVVSAAYFMGFSMLMSGHIPSKRVKILVPHAVVGVLSPLLYMLNISAGLDGVGTRPVSGLALACSILSLAVLGGQYLLGRAMVRPERLRVLRPIEGA
jgi:hypothetical protein